MNAELPHTMRELHSRTNDGIHVRLLWDPVDGRIAVAVADARTGDHFAFEVPERGRALHAFKHPFSYAAWRRVGANSSVGTLAALGEPAA